MFKRLIAFFLACIMSTAPLVTQAGDLGSVLDDLSAGAVVSVNQPGRFQSSARSNYSMGGFDMRVGPTKNTPVLVSFTPPKFDAGCAGVSAFFGGFSFISGKEFEQLLKSISSGVALGFVAHLALKTLCPQCEAVVQLMQRLNQVASMAAKDSCKYGQSLAQKFLGDKNASPDQQAKCKGASEQASSEGSVSDFLAGINGSICSSLSEMNSWLDKNVIARMQDIDNTPGMTPAQKQDEKDKLTFANMLGNETWMLTGQFFKSTFIEGETQRQIIMNMLGTTIRGNEGSCGGKQVDPNQSEGLPCIGTLTPKEVMDLFMCGVEARMPAGAAESVKSACKSTAGFSPPAGMSEKTLYECKYLDTNKDCLHLEAFPVKSSHLFNQYTGLSFQVNALLREAVARVQADTAMYQGPSDATGRKILGLIQTAPYPIYQAINAAAVYPAAASSVLDSLSVLIAEQLATTYFEEYFRVIGRATEGAAFSKARLDVIVEALESMSNRVNAIKGQTATSIALQEGITQSIRSLNQAVQRQVMTEEVFGANQFGKGLSGLVSGNKGNPTTTGAGTVSP